MAILACGVRLPNLNIGISNQSSVGPEDPPDELDDLAARTARIAFNLCEIKVMIPERMLRIIWADDLLWSYR
jgi:hypothetical protein